MERSADIAAAAAVVDFYSSLLRSLVQSEWRNRLRRSWQLTERRKEGTKAQKQSGKRIIIFDEAELKRPATAPPDRPPRWAFPLPSTCTALLHGVQQLHRSECYFLTF